MSEDQKEQLETQLWNIADEFRDYILGFIFYKYLSEKQHLCAYSLLETEAARDYRKVTSEEDLDLITNKKWGSQRGTNKKATVSDGLFNLAPPVGLEPTTL